MQLYPLSPSFAVDAPFTLCLQPQAQFGVALFRQDDQLTLTPLARPQLLSYDPDTVTPRGGGETYVTFSTTGPPGPFTAATDWGWPQVQLALPQSALPISAAYVAVIFPVDDRNAPTDALGQKVLANVPITPYPPDSDAMALIVGRPPSTAQPAPMAYIIPWATYHAYNGCGGACFYAYQGLTPPILGTTTMTTRRPGGGLGAYLGEPTDPYDQSSPRQQFAHWDQKFLAWLNVQADSNLLPQVDVLTDLDLDNSLNTSMGEGPVDISKYAAIISAGHHEYWSDSMSTAMVAAVANGSNYACFSGNTYYRTVRFLLQTDPAYGTFVTAGNTNTGNESILTGLSFAYGGGQWGVQAADGSWSKTGRPNYGFAVQKGQSSSWVFTGTGLKDGASIGGWETYLVGYEADGLAPQNKTVKVLAQSPPLTGFQFGAKNRASMVISKDPGNGVAKGAVFNAGTTDWARVLSDTTSASNAVVARITLNVLRKFSRFA